MLDPIHNQGLRLALGAFRTSPVASLYVEADEPSLNSQREKLSLQYAIRFATNPSNPAHEGTFPPNYVNLYEQKPKAIKSFGIRISPLLESANIKPQNIEKHFTPTIPAWCMNPPEILLDLHFGKKSESNPHILKVCLFVLLLYVPSQQLWSWRDGQFTYPHFFLGKLEQAVNQYFVHILSLVTDNNPS